MTWKDQTYAGGWSPTSTGSAIYLNTAGDISVSNGDTGVVVRIEVGTAGGAAFGQSVSVQTGDQQVRVGWQSPDDGGAIGQGGSGGPGSGGPIAPPTGTITPITTYEVAWTLEGADWSDGGSETVETEEATVTGLQNGQSYAFRVRYSQAGETSEWSETVYATPVEPATAPGAPEAPTATAGDGTLTVAWTAPSESGSKAISSYELDAVVKDTEWNSEPLLTGLTATEAELSELTNGTEYAIRVRAVSNAGNGEWSETAYGTPVAPDPPPPLIAEFEDASIYHAGTLELDMSDHFSGAELTFSVLVTTTNQRTGKVKTGPLNEIARNKVTANGTTTC